MLDDIFGARCCEGMDLALQNIPFFIVSEKNDKSFFLSFFDNDLSFFYRFEKTINRFDVRIVANFMKFTQTQPLSNVEPTMCSVRKQKPLRVRIQTNNNSNALNYCSN